MKRTVLAWLAALVIGVMLGLAGPTGCAESKPKMPPPPARPGDPVSGKTNYFLILENGQKQYYYSDEDLKIAINRLQAAGGGGTTSSNKSN